MLRLSRSWTILAATASLLSASAPAEGPDYNAQGFAAYKAKQYPKAKGLFEKAIQSDSKNPYAWFNYARILSVTHDNQPPEDACGDNWIWESLHALTVARELDAAKLDAKLAEKDPGTLKLKELAEVQVWMSAVKPPKTAAEVQALLKKHRSWTLRLAGEVPISFELAAGGKVTLEPESPLPAGLSRPKGWSLEGSRVVLDLGKAGKKPYAIQQERHHFKEGTRFFPILILKVADEGFAGEPRQLELPVSNHDC